MTGLLRDIRHGARLLVRDRTFSLTVLLTLTVCVGANVAIFGVVRTVVLDPLPFDRSERLVRFLNSYPNAGVSEGSTGSTDYFLRRGNLAGIEELALYQSSGATVGEAGRPERLTILRATPSLFPVLRVEAALGRVFLEEEMDPGHEPTVVLTHDYWQEQLGGGLEVVGQTLRIDGTPTTIVGVLPERFVFPAEPDARFVVPLVFDESERSMDNWHNNSYAMLGRLADGASVEQVTAQVSAVNDAAIDEWPVPNARELVENTGFHTIVIDAKTHLVRDVRQAIVLLWVGALFVLLIGCTNIANLMLVRAQLRLRELATRLSLGAQRGRIARQILTEAGVIGVAGAVGGVAFGAIMLRLLASFGIQDLPRGAEVGVDPGIVFFAVLLSLLSAAVFGAIPIAHLFRTDLGSVFREEGRTGTAGRGSMLLRSGLVAAQVAIAFLLLVGAGLMFRSFQSALDVDPGFDPSGTLTAHVSLPATAYPDEESRRLFIDEFLSEARAVPGVSAAGISTQIPLGPGGSTSAILPEGYEMAPGESVVAPRASRATSGYFDAMGIPILEGRDFGTEDGPDSPRVLVIDQWLADRYWPGQSPLGQRMIAGESLLSDEISDDDMYTIVGVVGNVKFEDVTEADDEYRGAYYMSARQDAPVFMGIAARGEVAPETLTAGLRSALGGVDAELPLFLVGTMESLVADSLSSRRTPAVLLIVFAGVALFLAVVGIYGVLAYLVSQRTREIGIRMALGSEPAGIFSLVVGQGVRLIAGGLVAGAVGAYLLVRLIESLLFGVAALDPAVFAVTAVVLAGAAVAACAVPARHATRIDSVSALMQDQ